MTLPLCAGNTNVEHLFNKGITMAVNAYETQVKLFINEIRKLNEQIQEKDVQFNKLQEICAMLIHDKQHCETKLTENQTYTAQLRNKIEELSKENIELKTIKATILATIEDSSSGNNKQQPRTINVNNNNSGNACKDKDHFQPVKPNKMYPKSTNVSMGNIFLNAKQSFPKKLPNNNNTTTPTNKSLTLAGPCCENNNTSLGNCLNAPNTAKERNKTPISFSKHITTSGRCTGQKVYPEGKEENKYCQSEGKVYKSVSRIDKYQITEKKCEKRNLDFFKKCRTEMNKQDYVNLIDVVHSYNHKSIGKDVMYQKIKTIFDKGNYKELFNDFNNLFT